jgi:DNA-binding helix-hairpin-helix protein with protein kinase domain
MQSTGQILKPKQIIKAEKSGARCTIQEFLGSGGQGEVYRVEINNQNMAIKWYFTHMATPQQRSALEMLIKRDAPNDKFLWPLELVSAPTVQGYGYLMQLRDPHYKNIVDLMKRRIEPNFRTLVKTCSYLADSFFQLHASGLCYRDISFGNVFFEPNRGDILICDNDNVAIDGQSFTGILGTPRFMAPEIVRGEVKPSTRTDLYSLSVLLFYLLLVSHPLEGKKEASIRCFDLPAMNKIYGFEPLFIFDPYNSTNRPVKGIHDNALEFWQIYPQFIRDLFTRAFTLGIVDPEHGRVGETEWRAALTTLVDLVLYCPTCGAENFYDKDVLRTKGKLAPCWSCKKDVPLPYRLKIGRNIIMLNHDTVLFPHHLNSNCLYDFSKPSAEVTRHPVNPRIWGLKNLSLEKWVMISSDGEIKDIDPGRSASLIPENKINFGNLEGEIEF